MWINKCINKYIHIIYIYVQIHINMFNWWWLTAACLTYSIPLHPIQFDETYRLGCCADSATAAPRRRHGSAIGVTPALRISPIELNLNSIVVELHRWIELHRRIIVIYTLNLLYLLNIFTYTYIDIYFLKCYYCYWNADNASNISLQYCVVDCWYCVVYLWYGMMHTWATCFILKWVIYSRPATSHHNFV